MVLKYANNNKVGLRVNSIQKGYKMETKSASNQAVEIEVVKAFPDGRLDTKNASKYIGLSERTMAQLRWRGKGPKYIKRGLVFYFLKDLDAWLKEGEAIHGKDKD